MNVFIQHSIFCSECNLKMMSKQFYYSNSIIWSWEAKPFRASCSWRGVGFAYTLRTCLQHPATLVTWLPVPSPCRTCGRPLCWAWLAARSSCVPRRIRNYPSLCTPWTCGPERGRGSSQGRTTAGHLLVLRSQCSLTSKNQVSRKICQV